MSESGKRKTYVSSDSESDDSVEVILNPKPVDEHKGQSPPKRLPKSAATSLPTNHDNDFQSQPSTSGIMSVPFTTPTIESPVALNETLLSQMSQVPFGGFKNWLSNYKVFKLTPEMRATLRTTPTPSSAPQLIPGILRREPNAYKKRDNGNLYANLGSSFVSWVRFGTNNALLFSNS